jgi:hypothetical protein
MDLIRILAIIVLVSNIKVIPEKIQIPPKKEIGKGEKLFLIIL